MALKLTLDVVSRGVLAWNQSNVVVPAGFKATVAAYDVGAVIEAECAWLSGGLTVRALGAVRQPTGDLDAQLRSAIERENWRGVLTQLDGAETTPHREAYRALEQRRLGDFEGFTKTYCALVSMEGVELVDPVLGLWSLRREFPDEQWAAVDRRVRAQTWKLLWQATLRSRSDGFRSHPFADSLWTPFDALLEAVEPQARPERVMAGGPRIDYGFDGFEVVVAGAMFLRRLADDAEWREVEPACRALAASSPKSRDGLTEFRRRAGNEVSLANVVLNLVAAVSNRRGTAASERAIALLGGLLASGAPSAAADYLRQLDALALCREAAGLVPKTHHKLRTSITAVHYRGSLDLKRDELDAVLGEAGGRWFALRRHETKWLVVEGSREDVLATMPDALFEEAVVKLHNT
ncbi:MAG: hypothetical protein JNM17_37795 [Archangium sp.]|nr:hypothetical protein [Archangium sp.]